MYFWDGLKWQSDLNPEYIERNLSLFVEKEDAYPGDYEEDVPENLRFYKKEYPMPSSA